MLIIRVIPLKNGMINSTTALFLIIKVNILYYFGKISAMANTGTLLWRTHLNIGM